MKERHRAYAYITHENRLLLFTHPNSPEAGIQVPAGTIEPGEEPAVAVMREAWEESGLEDLELVHFLGKDTRDMNDCGTDELQHRSFFHLRCTAEPPEQWRHGEHSESGELIIPFEFFWCNVGDLPKLVANYDDKIGALLESLEEMSKVSEPASEYEAFQVETGGQDVLVTWFPARDMPEGQRHGSGGICVTDKGEIVLATQDGETWGFPAGRPEGSESWEETLRREMREEACVEVRDAKLLGFSRGECIRGHEEGLVLVRSIWLARVELNEWVPEYETLARKLVQPERVLSEFETDVFLPLHHRALIAAGLLK